ncbi:uncharacterized protein G2W53_043344 [Senna tora]|uniref:Uncharacterized protein n=1 Tax=Senna tora TaxID=362788 RepID=A0A834SHL7_9FABA|nr:uncharacterized protein G2W53_043344 [Senna tora]
MGELNQKAKSKKDKSMNFGGSRKIM